MDFRGFSNPVPISKVSRKLEWIPYQNLDGLAASPQRTGGTIFGINPAAVAGGTGQQVRRGVVQMSTGAWFDPRERGAPGSVCKHGNPNVLTIDKGTSRLAQGPMGHSCLVEVEKFPGEPAPVTAYDPPEIIDEK